MFSTHVSDSSQSATLTGAILLYGGDARTGQGGSFATVHRVETINLRPEIMPGRPMMEADLVTIASNLAAAKEAITTTWLDPSMLARGADRMIWWTPPARRPMFFKESNLVKSTFNGNPPKQLWAEFLEHARAAMPNEAAALLVWNRMEGTWRLALRSATAASAVRIEYVNPQLADDEIAVIDVHSHGDLPAFFSQEDNADDAGGIKLSVVFGHIGKERPEIVSRLVCLDRFIPLRMNVDGGFEVEGRLQ